MQIKFTCLNFIMPLNFFIFLVIFSFASPILGFEPRKLDDTAVPAGPSDAKCSPCYPASPPPPPPPSPCPPPPALPPPVLPPPAPKKPPSSYCPPPPPSSYIYITGPPGNLYPVVNDYSGASRATSLPVLIGSGLFGYFLIFGL